MTDMGAQLDALLFDGMRVIESELLVEDGEPYTVPRPWRERLFTWPWHPFTTTRTVVPKVPYRGALQLDTRTLVMHPATFRTLKEQIKCPGN